MNTDQLLQLWQLPDMAKKASTHGGEYASACPACGGRDRFRIWPNQGKYGKFWCRRCGKHGDLIDFLRWQRGMSWKEACQAVGRDDSSIPRIKLDMRWTEPVITQNAPPEFEPTPDDFARTLPGCKDCEANVKGWCSAHPRNQFVNVRFVDECPKQIAQLAA